MDKFLDLNWTDAERMLNGWMICSAWTELIAELMDNFLGLNWNDAKLMADFLDQHGLKMVLKWSQMVSNGLKWSQVVSNWSQTGLKLV